MLPIFKLLTPKVVKAIMKYVFEENDLDQQMGSVRARLDKIEDTLKDCIKTNIGDREGNGKYLYAEIDWPYGGFK